MAWSTSGAESGLGRWMDGGFDGRGAEGREIGEKVEELDDGDDADDDAGDVGSCGYNDAGSSIARFWKSSSRELDVFDGPSVLASPMNSAGSSDASTV